MKNTKINISDKGVHFYWSQKKASIAQDIYNKYCKPGDVIMDPFLGGGSSLYAIRNTAYKFIGVELNELPCKIAEFNTHPINNKLISKLKITFHELKSKLNHLYEYKSKDNSLLEFKKVIFSNKQNPAISNIYFENKHGKQIVYTGSDALAEEYKKRFLHFFDEIKALDNVELIKNSRIAISDNMLLSDIFSPINFYILTKIKSQIGDNHEFKFIIGSILHLCKLTDMHSQSQFPYWIPKNNIVDRNIFNTIESKINSLEKLLGQGEIPNHKNINELLESRRNGCIIINKPIQGISNEDVPDNSVDFILTDPPYFDQVAYSEYLKIWEFFLGYKSNLEDEIVVSQRKKQPSNEVKYLKNIESSFLLLFNKLKMNSLMYVYFKDSRLDKMGDFLQTLKNVGFEFIGQEHIKTQKFTYKQNASTKTTISGECILKFRKYCNNEIKYISKSLEDRINVSEVIKTYVVEYLKNNSSATLGEILNSGLVKVLFENNALQFLKKSKTLVNVIESFCVYNKISREYSLK